jgi:hypothetical protein
MRHKDHRIVGGALYSAPHFLLRHRLAVLGALPLGLRAENYDDGFDGWSWDDENEIVFGKPAVPIR